MGFKDVKGKFLGMRKEQVFTVYPRTPDSDEVVKIQSDRAIGMFDPKTGKGLLNWRGSNSKYNHHLMPALGAEPCDFPMEFVNECIGAANKEGDHLGCGVYVGQTGA